MTIDSTWWKDATVYQVWPASYKDSNGDGIGDIPGIISSLDYMKDLGVDVLWVSPMFDSPQDDMGYDISDYEKVYPKYGTLEDMDKLIDGCHKRDMKLILDLVINHTSSEHQWFKESSSSKTNPKRDWYIWKPAKYDAQGNRQPPNNWESYFSGSAWRWDEKTQEYYLALFAASQPDLNWENEEARNAIYDSALNFWYKRGVDGFRIDTAGLYSKVQTFPDAPIIYADKEFQPAGSLSHNGPRIHEFHKEMFQKATSKYDAMTVGEVGLASKDDLVKYTGASSKEMSMMFLFRTVMLGCNEGDRFDYHDFDLVDFKNAIKQEVDLVKDTDAWIATVIENHDQPRAVSRFGSRLKKHLFDSAKTIALLEATLSGTLYIYQGQEIAMTNLPESWDLKEYQDINTINYWRDYSAKYGDNKEKMDHLMKVIQLLARDHARSPVQWSADHEAGFTTGKPWTRVNDNYKEINVESQIDDPNSVLSFYKKALAMRKEHKDVFIYGDTQILDFDNKETITYLKKHGKKTAYVVLNFTDHTLPFKRCVEGDLELVLSTHDADAEQLAPWEGRAFILS